MSRGAKCVPVTIQSLVWILCYGSMIVLTTEEVTTRDRFSISRFKDLLNITIVYHVGPQNVTFPKT